MFLDWQSTLGSNRFSDKFCLCALLCEIYLLQSLHLQQLNFIFLCFKNIFIKGNWRLSTLWVSSWRLSTDYITLKGNWRCSSSSPIIIIIANGKTFLLIKPRVAGKCSKIKACAVMIVDFEIELSIRRDFRRFSSENVISPLFYHW